MASHDNTSKLSAGNTAGVQKDTDVHTEQNNDAKGSVHKGKGDSNYSNGSKDDQTDSSERVPPKVDNLDVPDDPFGDEYTDRRLWIGNLDQRLTESV